MRGERVCAPCHSSFMAPTQEHANAMFDEHVQSCHPEAAQIKALTESVTQLVGVIEQLMKPQLSLEKP